MFRDSCKNRNNAKSKDKAEIHESYATVADRENIDGIKTLDSKNSLVSGSGAMVCSNEPVRVLDVCSIGNEWRIPPARGRL